MDSALRARARACLTGDALLRVDRGCALYVSDCTDAQSALTRAGFDVRPRGQLIAISPARALLPFIGDTIAPVGDGDALLRQFQRLTDRPVGDAEMALLASALKGIEPGGARDAHFEKKLRQLAAVCLRNGTGGALALIRKIQRTAEEVIQ